MVPHHNNAVNMAKILLKMDVLDADDEDDAGIIDMLWAIINAQNYQNHNMEALAGGGRSSRRLIARDTPAPPMQAERINRKAVVFGQYRYAG